MRDTVYKQIVVVVVVVVVMVIMVGALCSCKQANSEAFQLN